MALSLKDVLRAEKRGPRPHSSTLKAKGLGKYISMDELAESWKPNKVFVSERLRKRPLQGLSQFRNVDGKNKQRGLSGYSHSFAASFGSTPTGRDPIPNPKNVYSPSSRSVARKQLRRTLSQQSYARDRALRMSSSLSNMGVNTLRSPISSPRYQSGKHPYAGKNSASSARKLQAAKAPFGSATSKKSYFDQFLGPCEDEDPSLYADKVHLWVRMQSRLKANQTLAQDRAHWNSKSVIIDGCIDRGLLPSKDPATQSTISSRSELSVPSSYLSEDDIRRLSAYRCPRAGNSSASGAGALVKSSSAFLATSRSQHEDRVWKSRTGSSGLGPPQVSIGRGSMTVQRPRHASVAFLATGKNHTVPNQR